MFIFQIFFKAKSPIKYKMKYNVTCSCGINGPNTKQANGNLLALLSKTNYNAMFIVYPLNRTCSIVEGTNQDDIPLTVGGYI